VPLGFWCGHSDAIDAPEQLPTPLRKGCLPSKRWLMLTTCTTVHCSCLSLGFIEIDGPENFSAEATDG